MKKGYVTFCKSALFATALIISPCRAADMSAASQSFIPASDGTIANIQQALDDQRYLDAGKLLDQAILVSGNDPRLTYWTGELNLARRRYEDALTNFKSIETDPKVAGAAREGKGIALAQLGRVEEAIISLQSAVEANPPAWRAWNALGSELDQRHDWAAADTAYSHALSVSGGAAIVLNNRGFSRLSQGKLDDAIADFVAALKKKPDLSSARNNLRLALAMKGEYARAMAGASAGELAAILNNVGYAAMLRGDYGDAKDLLERAMKAKGEYYGVAAANLETTRGLSKNAESAEHAPLIEIVRLLVQGSLVAVLCIVSVSDIRRRRIPNWAVLTIAGLFVPWTWVGGTSSLFSSLEAALIVLALSAAMYASGLLGAGDSKLTTVCALFVGMAQLMQFLLLIAIVGGVLAIAKLSLQPTRALVLFQMRGRGSSDSGLPYGVAIAIAAICVVLLPLSSMPMFSWMP